METIKSFTFKQMAIEEFNAKFGLDATKEMDLEAFTDHIEDTDLRCFYASCSDEDVVRAIQDEQETVNLLPSLETVLVENFYLAIY